MVIATLQGEIDISNVAEIGEEIRDAIGNDPVGLCLHLDEVRYVDSAGIRMVFDLVARLEACRQRVAIVMSADAPIRRLIEITNLGDLVTIHDAVDACVEHLDGSLEDLL